ncbi:MAG: archaetidylserine decarboxylase [Isosphaeraceae bacterium]
MTLASRLSIRLEQMRQARTIHGGLISLGLAALAVKLSRVPIPSRRVRRRVFRDQYVRRYPPGLDEAESERPLEDYQSLNALFTRGLRAEARPIAAGREIVLSPCDGRVQDVGRVDGGTLLTVKGIAYSVASLLADGDARPFEGGLFAVVFLSPIDCHRVFSPADGRLERVVHVPGSRLLVHPPLQRPEYPVYTLNERVILHLSTPAGPMAVVMVAGWGVGHVTGPLVPRFRSRSRRIESFDRDPPPAITRGDWMATFELGSTVVLLTPSMPGAIPLVTPNEKVRYGQPLFRLDEPARDR